MVDPIAVACGAGKAKLPQPLPRLPQQQVVVVGGGSGSGASAGSAGGWTAWWSTSWALKRLVGLMGLDLDSLDLALCVPSLQDPPSLHIRPGLELPSAGISR